MIFVMCLQSECIHGALSLATIEVNTFKMKKIDGLVNNAAGNFISPTERLSANAFDTIIDIVLKGTKNCTLAFGKHWIAKNETEKVVLNIVTTYAWTGSAYVVPSATAKAGVLALTRSLAVEWAKYGMRFNAIAPGPFPTKGAWDRLLPGDLKEKFEGKTQQKSRARTPRGGGGELGQRPTKLVKMNECCRGQKKNGGVVPNIYKCWRGHIKRNCVAVPNINEHWREGRFKKL